MGGTEIRSSNTELASRVSWCAGRGERQNAGPTVQSPRNYDTLPYMAYFADVIELRILGGDIILEYLGGSPCKGPSKGKREAGE